MEEQDGERKRKMEDIREDGRKEREEEEHAKEKHLKIFFKNV